MSVENPISSDTLAKMLEFIAANVPEDDPRSIAGATALRELARLGLEPQPTEPQPQYLPREEK